MNRKGFTLVELIATIALLAVISTISFVSINGVLEKRKVDECQMLVNNIKSAAKDYVSDNRYNSVVGSSENKSVKFNVGVLLDENYLTGDMHDPFSSEALDIDRMKIFATLKDDYTVEWIDIVYDDELYNCENTIVAENDNTAPVIKVNVSDGNVYSKSKEAVITLQDSGVGLKGGTYQLKYGWGTSTLSCSDLSQTVSITASDGQYDASTKVLISDYTGNGNLYVCNASSIKDSLGNTLNANTRVSHKMYLDNTGPIITIDQSNIKIVDRDVSIPLKLTDSHSGVDKNSFILSDISVKADDSILNGGYELNNTSGNNYSLIIYDLTSVEKISISIDAGKVLDKLGNKNIETNLTADVDINSIFTIKYNGNGATSGTVSNTECTYGSSCAIKSNSFVRSGYTFEGWTTNSDGTDDGYNWTGWSGNWTYDNGDKGITNNVLTLYARWRKNVVIIKYNVNGGTIATSTGSNTWSTSDSLIYKNGNLLTTRIGYGDEIGTDGLVNYNNSSYVNITKTGYAGVSGKEWICLSGCTTSGATFNHNTETYMASNFCNAINGDCTVVLGVNWAANTYTITYDANGGSGAPASQLATAGINVTLSNTIPTRNVNNKCNSHDNYIFLGWSTNSSDESASYSAGDSFKKDNTNNITLYAIWELDSVRFTVSSKKVKVYQLPSCSIGGICNYDKINSYANIGTINKSDTYTKSGVNDLKIASTYYMSSKSLTCYCSPSTSSTVKQTFPWCEDWMNDNNGDLDPNYITVWNTTVDGWYYSRTYDCFVQKSKLVSSIQEANLTECPKE